VRSTSAGWGAEAARAAGAGRISAAAAARFIPPVISSNFSSLTSSSPGSNTGSYIILKSFILPASSKNKFRIWSLYALIFGTTTGGGAGAEPDPSDSAPELAPGENNNRATTPEEGGDLLEESAADERVGVPKICEASGKDAVGAWLIPVTGVPDLLPSGFRGGVSVPDIVIHNPETFSENGS
jgi:hypothetical protein